MMEPVKSQIPDPKTIPVIAPRVIPSEPLQYAPLTEPEIAPASAKIVNKFIAIASLRSLWASDRAANG